jgi:hypothetical protein
MIYYREEIFDKFKDISEVVFDTNLYGMSSWINITEPGKAEDFPYNDLFDPPGDEFKICSGKNFKYLKSDDDTIISQHIWALVKLFTCLETVEDYDDTIYDFLMKKLLKVDGNLLLLLKEAFKTISLYPSDVKRLPNIMNLITYQKGVITPNFYNNFISFVSYNSPESYFTRGTFLDVVLNQQTCKSSPEQRLELNADEYLDSFIENMSEILTYYRKDKYIQRAKSSLKNFHLNGKFRISPTLFTQTEINLNEITTSQSECNDTAVLALCTPFEIMEKVLDTLLPILNHVFNVYYGRRQIETGIQNFIIEDRATSLAFT